MRLSTSFFHTYKEIPSDEESKSGQLLVKAGMIRKSSSGVYMLITLGYRVIRKLETLIRREMEAIGCQEMLMPAMVPEEVYSASGRLIGFGADMLKFQDRYQKKYALAPTHEELFAKLASVKIKSYKDFPFSLYQFQTKYRDERRPRFGLIRVREFLMKDAYSFHDSLEQMTEDYQKFVRGYRRIFDQLGLRYHVVQADTGTMGGLLSEEFQAVSSIGEDNIAICERGDYAQNVEIASANAAQLHPSVLMGCYQLVFTPQLKSATEVSKFLQVPITRLLKTMVYQVEGQLYALMLDGEHQVNEKKLEKHFGTKNFHLATPQQLQEHGLVSGFLGPIGLSIPIIVDVLALSAVDFVVGANQTDYHFQGVNWGDFTYQVADFHLLQEGDGCPRCGGQLRIEPTIEVGNTFQLGTHYSEKLGLTFTTRENQAQPFYMGSYGIGLGRLLAAIVEQRAEDNQLHWPLVIAPYHINILVYQVDNPQQLTIAEELYRQLGSHFEVMLDDRQGQLGFKLKDSDLLGIPVKIIVGKHAVTSSQVEVIYRQEKHMWAITEVDELRTHLASILV